MGKNYRPCLLTPENGPCPICKEAAWTAVCDTVIKARSWPAHGSGAHRPGAFLSAPSHPDFLKQLCGVGNVLFPVRSTRRSERICEFQLVQVRPDWTALSGFDWMATDVFCFTT